MFEVVRDISVARKRAAEERRIVGSERINVVIVQGGCHIYKVTAYCF